MNCDDVFDVLTRGPFPTGAATDAEVERHLSDCCECRQLAEALRPAVALFEEAMGAEEARVLPGYWGDLPTADAQTSAVATSAVRVAGLAREGRFSPRPDSMWRVAVVLVLGLAAAGAGVGIGWPENVSNAEYLVATACLTPVAEAAIHSDSHARSELRGMSAAEISAALHCCTDCHSSERKQLMASPVVAQMALTCKLCHPK